MALIINMPTTFHVGDTAPARVDGEWTTLTWRDERTLVVGQTDARRILHVEVERPGLVKTSVWLPEALWKRAKVRAVEERVDLRDVIIAALEGYLKAKKGGDR